MSLKQQLELKDEKEKETMQQQNNISTTSRTGKNSSARFKGYNEFKNIGATNSGTLTQSSNAFDFLNHHFAERSAIEIGAILERPLFNFNNNLYEIGIEDTLDAAYECMLNYAKIKGVEIEAINSDCSVFDRALDFNKNIKKLLPEGVGYNIDHDYNNDVHIVLYKPTNSWDSTIFFIPIEPLTHLKYILSEKLYKLVFEAVALLINNACIPKWNEGRFEVILQIIPNELEDMIAEMDNEEELSEYEDIVAGVDSYNSVEAKRALKKLSQTRLKVPTVKKRLESYRAKSAFAKSIKQLALEALELILPGENLHNYDYHPFDEDYGDAVSVDNLIVATWADDDVIARRYIEWIDMDANEFGALVPYHNVKITNTSKHDLQISEWPDKLAEWVIKYNQILTTNF